MSAVLQKKERPKYSGTAGRSTNWDMCRSARSTAFPHSLMTGCRGYAGHAENVPPDIKAVQDGGRLRKRDHRDDEHGDQHG